MEQLLWEFSIRATLIAAGTAFVLWALRIRTATARHAAWASIMLLMLLLPAWTAWGPKAPFRVLPPLKTVRDPRPLVLPAAPVHSVSVQPGESIWSGRGLLAAIYAVGFCALLGRLLIGTVRANRLARSAKELQGRLTNTTCAAPMTVGWFRPRVILPEYWLSWPQAQLYAVLVHEQEHVRRRDPLVQWLALLNRAIFWFHPLAWWLERKLSALAEEACDAAVLESGQDARDYSEYLLDIARSVMQAGGRVHVMGAAMPGSFLPTRLRQILGTRVVPKISRPRAICMATACALTTAVFAAGTLDHSRRTDPVVLERIAPKEPPAPPEKRPPTTLAQAVPKPAPAPSPQMPDPYKKWLDEEAVYIITPAERTAFMGLRTNEERQQFIAQFWARRNPTPGAATNPFQEEHYRRIAYANDRFGFADTPGWQTDRGRIYITFGPADELEEHSTPIPSQRWRYRFIEGIGYDVNMEFVDTAKDGAFHMTMDPR